MMYLQVQLRFKEIVELGLRQGTIYAKDGRKINEVRPLGKPRVFDNCSTERTLVENIRAFPELLTVTVDERDELGRLEIECLGVMVGTELKRPFENGYPPAYPVQFYAVNVRKDSGW